MLYESEHGEMTLKIRLRELMDEKSKRQGRAITQAEVARAVGVDSGTLSRYANGYVAGFKNDILERLMDYFQVEPGDILVREREDDRTKSEHPSPAISNPSRTACLL